MFWQRSAIAGGAELRPRYRIARCPAAPRPPGSTPSRGADLAYKKIDSLLRGNTAHEIAACLASGRFASALIAPAFPAQQRITRGGRQYWRPASSQAWQPVACDLAGALGAAGIELRLAAAAADVARRGCFLCDAETEDDLLRARRCRRAPGAAGALGAAAPASPARSPAAPLRPPLLPDLEPPLLMVIGSHHPVTLAQIEELQASSARYGRVGSRPRRTIETRARGARRAAPCAALVMTVADGTGAERAQPFFDRVLAAAADRLAPPRSLVVSGGATLHRLVSVLGARSLLVTGEPLPGVPRSVLQGGRWDGAVVISKSGGFGEPRLLIRLADCAKG